jgi:hypothetical protein
MARISVPRARATISESPEGLLITIPAKKNWLIILSLGFWLIGWLFGEGSAIHELVRGHSSHRANAYGSAPVGMNLFMVVWLIGWTLGGALAAIIWLWNFAGFEKVLLGPSTLTTKQEVAGIGLRKEYELQSVENLRVVTGAVNFSGRMSLIQMRAAGLSLSITGQKRFASESDSTKPRRSRLSSGSSHAIHFNRDACGGCRAACAAAAPWR